MKTFWRRLDEDVLMTSFKMSSRCLQDVLPRRLQEFSGSLQDVFQKRLQDGLKMSIFKTSWRRLCKTSWRRLGKTSWRRLEDILKMSWRRLEDVWLRRTCLSWSRRNWRRLQDVFWRRMTIYIRLGQDVLETSSEGEEERRLQDVFKRSSSRRMFGGTSLVFSILSVIP